MPEDAFDESMPMSEILAAIRESIADENKDVPNIATPSATKVAASTSDDDILDLTVEVGPDDKSLAGATASPDETPVASLQADALAIGDDLIAMELQDPDGDIDALIDAAVASEEAEAVSGLGRPAVDGAYATSSAIEQLARGIANTRTPESPNPSENLDEGANDVSSIEAFVAELVRDWLDKNMPTIVEDVVARELAKKTDI